MLVCFVLGERVAAGVDHASRVEGLEAAGLGVSRARREGADALLNRAPIYSPALHDLCNTTIFRLGVTHASSFPSLSV